MKKKILVTTCICCLLCGCGSGSDAATSSQDSSQTETASAEMKKRICRKVDLYDYANDAPASEVADESYFSDAFFGGDSRMGSLALYSDLANYGADIYYGESLRLWSIESMDIDTGSGTDTMYNIIMNTTRNNIYLLLGINEIRSESFDDWAAYYEEIITAIIEKHPDANIYLMRSYYPQELSGIEPELLKQNIDTINEDMKNIAVKHHLYMLGIDSSMKDESGKVREDLVWDGLHFNEAGAQLYANYVASHVVRKEDYVKEICE